MLANTIGLQTLGMRTVHFSLISLELLEKANEVQDFAYDHTSLSDKRERMTMEKPTKEDLMHQIDLMYQYTEKLQELARELTLEIIQEWGKGEEKHG